MEDENELGRFEFDMVDDESGEACPTTLVQGMPYREGCRSWESYSTLGPRHVRVASASLLECVVRAQNATRGLFDELAKDGKRLYWRGSSQRVEVESLFLGVLNPVADKPKRKYVKRNPTASGTKTPDIEHAAQQQ